MNDIFASKDFIELANVVISNMNYYNCVPGLREMHDVNKLGRIDLAKNKTYCTNMLFYFADEITKKHEIKYDLNVLFDFDLLKFIIYIYTKKSVGKKLSNREEELTDLLNSNRLNINSFDFSTNLFMDSKETINVQSEIYKYISEENK